ITPDQPLGWHASEGLQTFPLERTGRCHTNPLRTCNAQNASQLCANVCDPSVQPCINGCDILPNNLGSGIPPVPEDPFIGSLKCIEFDGNPPVPDQTTTTNTLIGNATIERRVPSEVPIADIEIYNAVGLQATQNSSNTNGPSVLQLGGNGAEFQACPATLILDHLFDFNSEFESNVTDLTLVPCGDNLRTQTPVRSVAQFLVFNEFEQRFSTSRPIDCFFESALSNIDTSASSRSIFSFTVAGTLAGQTRIRPVGDSPTGRGLVGVSRLFLN